MKKLLIALAAVTASLAGFATATDWFNAGLGGEDAFGGSWKTGAGVTAPTIDDYGNLYFEDASDPVVYQATEAKDASAGSVVIEFQCCFRGYESLPDIDPEAKTGITALDEGNYYVVAWDSDGATNKWVDTGIEAILSDGCITEVSITINDGTAVYEFGNGEEPIGTFSDVAVRGNSFREACFMGTGSAGWLVGMYDGPSAPSIAIDFANADVPGLEVAFSPAVKEAPEGTEIEATYSNGSKIGSGTAVYVVQSDGSLELKAGSEKPLATDPAAKILDTLYATVEDALADADGFDAVVIMKDVTISSLSGIKTRITIDANGFVVSLANAAMTLNQDLVIVCTGVGDLAGKGVKNDAQITIAAEKTLDLSALSLGAGIVASEAGTASFTLETGAQYKQGIDENWSDAITDIFSADDPAYRIALSKTETVATITTELIPQSESYTVTFYTNNSQVVDSLIDIASGTELTAEQIPAEISGLDGSWDVDPIGAVITCDTNFVFTVAEPVPEVYTVSFYTNSVDAATLVGTADIAAGSTIAAADVPAVFGSLTGTWDIDPVGQQVVDSDLEFVFTVTEGPVGDPVQEAIDAGKSGTAMPLGGAEYTLADDGKSFTFNEKTYEAKDHYVFEAISGGLVLAIDPSEAEISSIAPDTSDDTKMTIGTVQTVVGFCYQVKYADNLAFTGATLTDVIAGDGTMLTIYAPKGGDKQFYKLVVTDKDVLSE